MLSSFALAARSARSAPPLAGVEDVVLDLKITDPVGTPIIEEQSPLPFRQEERRRPLAPRILFIFAPPLTKPQQPR